MKQLPNEEAHIWSLPQLNGLSLFRARIVTYAFKRHMHDFFVVGLIENGVQKFSYRRAEHFTPPTGIIVLNPGEAHTGESAVQGGFEYRAFYPDTDLMRRVASDIQGFEHDLPFFGQPVIHDAALFQHIYNLHRTLETNHPSLEQESRLVWVLAQLITRHADAGFRLRPVKPERYETRRIRQYIEDHYAEDIRLDELAALVHWNPFYLLRVFRNDVGLPPHAYLETVRVQRACEFLTQKMGLAEVAYSTGFSSQSHFTTSFKSLIGVTPGQYVKAFHA